MNDDCRLKIGERALSGAIGSGASQERRKLWRNSRRAGAEGDGKQILGRLSFEAIKSEQSERFRVTEHA